MVVRVLGVINMLYGAASLVLGVLTCMKNITALRVGLVLNYVIATLQLLVLNLCGVGIMVVAILQAHPVLGLRRKLQAEGALLGTGV